ncbi:MAG: hypothetical protein KJZ83_13990, partial [Burkholderiaceae bacterium]|nr:hypothetical protein [Burkholderiaceae bacterium]
RRWHYRECAMLNKCGCPGSTGTTATGLQRAELVKLPVKIPPVAEQSIAAELLFSMSSRVGKERIHWIKLIQEKNGLMDDLLTGRVRVTPLLDPQETAATA